MPLRIRRGVEADRTGFTPLEGEPIYVTDTKKVYIGDGSTAGGVNISQALTVDTQDFTASGTWTKPANALWVEVTMCGAGENGVAGDTGSAGRGGRAGKVATKTFAAASLASTVSVTCATSSSANTSFGTHLYAHGGSQTNHSGGGATSETNALNAAEYSLFGTGGLPGGYAGSHGAAFGSGGGGGGGDAGNNVANGGAGGLASTNRWDADSVAYTGGGGAGGASGTTGVAGTAGGYDTITGFGHGGGGGGEGTAGAGGAGGAAVRGGGGGGGGKGTTAGGAGGAGGPGFVRVRTLCFG